MPGSAPQISVCVPVYDSGSYLKPCLDSILSQDFQDFELICVDDGSSDGSGQELDQRAATEPRMSVVHQANRGHAAARNVALDRARGRYLFFLDSDDYIEPGTFSACMDALAADNLDLLYFNAQQHNPEHVGYLVSQSVRVYKDISDSPVVDGAELYRLISLSSGSLFFPGVQMVRRQLVLDHGIRFDEELTRCTDVCFFLPLFEFCERGRFLDRGLCHRVARPQSVMHTAAGLDTFRAVYQGCMRYKPMLEHYYRIGFDAAATDKNLEKLQNRLLTEAMRLEPEETAALLDTVPLEQRSQLVMQVSHPAKTKRNSLKRKQTIDELKHTRDMLKEQRQHLRDQKVALQDKNQRLQEQNAALKAELAAIRASKSFRLGHALTAPGRALRRR